MRIVFLAAALAASVRLLAADFGPRFGAIVERASPAQLYAFLYDMPKGGDLHDHAQGANRPEWIYEVCTDPARNGGETFYVRARFDAAEGVDRAAQYAVIRSEAYSVLPGRLKREFVRMGDLSPAERTAWMDALRLDGTGDGRAKFFGQIWPRIGGLYSCLPVSAELLVENMKAFGAEHMAYLETQFTASGVGNDGTAIADEDAAAYVKARLARPDALATGVTVRFQRTILRFAPDAERRMQEAYRFVDAHRDLWVGLNIAGIEDNGRGYPLRFLSTLRQMRAVYPTLPLSFHAGEMDGPDRHVRDTLLLGASRIGHGVNLIKDPDTLLLMQQSRRVLIEINLISNRLLGYVPDLSKHPFPEYLRTGIPVCLNTDDRGMWDSNLTDEYYTAVTLFHLSWPEIVAMGRDSLGRSFAQPDVKARLLADFDARLAAFEGRYGSGGVDAAVASLASVKPVAYGYARRTWGLSF